MRAARTFNGAQVLKPETVAPMRQNHRRTAGSVAWAGLFNTYFWLDPNKRVTGTIMTQLLPFADDQVLKLFAKFDGGLYAAVA